MDARSQFHCVEGRILKPDAVRGADELMLRAVRSPGERASRQLLGALAATQPTAGKYQTNHIGFTRGGYLDGLLTSAGRLLVTDRSPIDAARAADAGGVPSEGMSQRSPRRTKWPFARARMAIFPPWRRVDVYVRYPQRARSANNYGVAPEQRYPGTPPASSAAIALAVPSHSFQSHWPWKRLQVTPTAKVANSML